MPGHVLIEAFAKINLHLHISGRRPDGYHDLESIFQSVDLGDRIALGSLKESGTITVEGEFDCPPEATTVWKAAEAYMHAAPSRHGVSIAVEKRIPAGAGLGGGSADAAATLVGLERLFGAGLDGAELARIGAGIGSDVPFFLHGVVHGGDHGIIHEAARAGAAIVAGRGEKVSPMAAREDLGIVLVYPGFHSSTAAAYAGLDALRSGQSMAARGRENPRDVPARYRLDPAGWDFRNDFEPVLFAAHPELGRTLELLRAEGASFASMTGSGSCVFGVFASRAAAGGALDRLRPELPILFPGASACGPPRAWSLRPLAYTLRLV